MFFWWWCLWGCQLLWSHSTVWGKGSPARLPQPPVPVDWRLQFQQQSLLCQQRELAQRLPLSTMRHTMPRQSAESQLLQNCQTIFVHRLPQWSCFVSCYLVQGAYLLLYVFVQCCSQLSWSNSWWNTSLIRTRVLIRRKTEPHRNGFFLTLHRMRQQRRPQTSSLDSNVFRLWSRIHPKQTQYLPRYSCILIHVKYNSNWLLCWNQEYGKQNTHSLL